MEKELRLHYDTKGTFLGFSMGNPQESISEDSGNDIWVMRSTETGNIVGLTILNFTKRFSSEKEVKIPVEAKFSALIKRKAKA
ncbi:MAG: hypothetical protein V2G33_02830 [bacterium JZ-2024 1]